MSDPLYNYLKFIASSSSVIYVENKNSNKIDTFYAKNIKPANIVATGLNKTTIENINNLKVYKNHNSMDQNINKYDDNTIKSAENLISLNARIDGCNRCPLSLHRKNVVFGNGNQKSKILFIGEGPGADEDSQGIPFVGRAGKLLNKMILAIGIDRSSIYITNIVKCRPPKNRNPLEEEMDACSIILDQQIKILKPQLIVIIGAIAMKSLLPANKSITLARGKVYNKNGIDYIVVFHPAYLLRNTTKLNLGWDDFNFIKTYIEEKSILKPTTTSS